MLTKREKADFEKLYAVIPKPCYQSVWGCGFHAVVMSKNSTPIYKICKLNLPTSYGVYSYKFNKIFQDDESVVLCRGVNVSKGANAEYLDSCLYSQSRDNYYADNRIENDDATDNTFFC